MRRLRYDPQRRDPETKDSLWSSCVYERQREDYGKLESIGNRWSCFSRNGLDNELSKNVEQYVYPIELQVYIHSTRQKFVDT